MKHSILITGVPGTGKTSISDELVRMGYKSYDMDRIHGLCFMVDKETGLPVTNHDNADLDKVRAMAWNCSEEKLRWMMNQETEQIAFYCGIPSNVKDIMPMFEKVILLKVDHTTNRERLAGRTGRNDFGRESHVQDWILGWKDSWEKEIQETGAVVIDAHGNPRTVVELILKEMLTRLPNF